MILSTLQKKSLPFGEVRWGFLLFLALLVSCDNEEEYKPAEPQIDYTANDNRNIGGNAVATRIETPHVNAAYLLVPHYADADGRRVLNYTVEWNAAMRHSSWVAFTWDSTTAAQANGVQRKNIFKWDTYIPNTQGYVTSADYTRNGYDKGHICASEDRVFSQDANDQTFFYSNMSPQFSSFNQGFWKELEARVRTWGRATLTSRYDTVYVVKGGTINRLLYNYVGHQTASDGAIPTTDGNGYAPRSDGKVGLPVPEYYYMALLSVKNGVYHAIAFIVPHSEDLPKTPTSANLQQFVTTIDNLEYFTGIDFFCNLIDRIESEVEATYSLDDWSW